MRVNQSFILREIAGENILVKVSNEKTDGKPDRNDTNAIMIMNDVGTFIWKAYNEKADFDYVLCKLNDTYDADPEVLKSNLEQFTDSLKEHGLLLD